MITQIKITMSDDADEGQATKYFEYIYEGKIKSSSNEFWPREMRVIEAIVNAMIAFNKNEKGHRGVKDDKP